MIAVIDCCGANFASLQCALQRLGVNAIFTSDKHQIRQADRVILPGVGSADYAMAALQQQQLVTVIRELTQPVLGICLGMQLLFDYSDEGETDCLGILNDRIQRFTDNPNYPVPHMGWNQITTTQQTDLLIDNNNYHYFVHSYFAPISPYTIASCDYQQVFSAAVNKNNFYGVQFHPEKSAEAGHTILKNFIGLSE